MGYRLIFFSLIVGVSWGFPNEIRTPWTQPCHYVTQHDPVTIVVDEDREFSVRYPSQGWTAVGAWTEGKALTLSYTEGTGAALLDPAAGLILPLVGWPDDGHPIDLILGRELSKTVTTLDECEAYERAANRWKREITRAFDLLATCPESGLDEVARITAAKKAWTVYSFEYLAGVSATLSRREGTMWSIVAARHHYTFFREQAALVFSLLEYAPGDLMAKVTATPPIKP